MVLAISAQVQAYVGVKPEIIKVFLFLLTMLTWISL